MKRTFPVLVLSTTCLSCSGDDVVIGIRDGYEGGHRSTSLPIGIANTNNSAMSSSSYRALLRFVPDETIEVDRIYFGFKIRGAACREPGAAGDGAGDGGIVHGELVTIDPESGLPAEVIAAETAQACTRHAEAEREVGATPVMGWVAVSATLSAGRMYGLIIKNAHSDPSNHFFSFHMPIADTILAGPQARNELDPTTKGALMSLDPREHVAWSEDGGAWWRYGSENGEYRSYINENTDRPATRIPHYGFRLSDGTNVPSQPYYAYKSVCTHCTVTYSARFARTLTQAGGFTASGTNVGTLTVTNAATGDSGFCAAGPGYGFRICQLDTPVSVSPGDDYSISSTGEVELMRMDAPQRQRFSDVGTQRAVHTAHQLDPPPGSNEKDVPSLWAGPVSPHFPASDGK